MVSLREFPSDRVERIVSPARYSAITKLVDAVERCQEHLSASERNAPYFKPLAKYHYQILSQGVGLSNFGLLFAASKNWLEHYKRYADGKFSPELNQSQRHLSQLCRTMNFTQIATRTDIMMHDQEMKRGAFRMLDSGRLK